MYDLADKCPFRRRSSDKNNKQSWEFHYVVIIYKPRRAPNKHKSFWFKYYYFENKITF